MDETITILMENFLHDSKKKNISREERATLIKELIKRKKCSVRQLARELGISHSTLHDWVSLRQNNTGEGMHISFSFIIRRLEKIDPNTFTDWGRLEQIKEIIEKLERSRPAKEV